MSRRISFTSLRVVVLALVTGVITFAAAAIAFRERILSEGVDPEVAVVLTMLVPFLAAMNLLGYFLLRRFQVGRLARRKEGALAELSEGSVPPELQQLTIVAAALVESVGLFGTVVFMLGGSSALLSVPGLAVLLMVLLMPNPERFEGIVRHAGE